MAGSVFASSLFAPPFIFSYHGGSMRIRRDESSVAEGIVFQRRIVAELQRHGPAAPGITDSFNGERLNLGEFFDRYSMTLWVLYELEQKFKNQGGTDART